MLIIKRNFSIFEKKIYKKEMIQNCYVPFTQNHEFLVYHKFYFFFDVLFSFFLISVYITSFT